MQDYAKLNEFVESLESKETHRKYLLAVKRFATMIVVNEMPPPDELEDAAYGVGFIWRRKDVVISAKTNNLGFFDFTYHAGGNDDIAGAKLQGHLMWNALWCAFYGERGYKF
jgi:hypothetical protein